MELLFPLLILFMIGLLFMSSRQRRKQQQQHEELTRSLEVGDVVQMTSGISGTIVSTEDRDTIDVEIAENVVTTWLRGAVLKKLTADDEDLDAEDAADGGDDAGTDLERAEAPADEAIGGTPTDSARPDLTKSVSGSESTSGSSRSS